MRLVKKWDKINISGKTQLVDPFRTIKLDEGEIQEILSISKGEVIETSQKSEDILSGILRKRGMQELLYPDRELDDWSGYCRLMPGGILMLL